ncbi:MAG: type II toxin-antitoxin system VapC family toxin [Gammaproteobacteria bacterium]|nr:type II toxin-antitoxin system VapC family toxin [Gammaproteobacteria bacterium]MYG11365.1 type II toxin-antitoxin system VapC family toxin [Gammaproteobacteria bacterium]MYK29426.1 type II toxin-antitoxin system VapC family toxin [Gammaproteobacteria bacterium]
MIFVDSNVPMYLVGAEHPNKARVTELLAQFIREAERLVTDVEVYQEVLHRYVSIGRHDAIDPAFASLDAIVDEVLPIQIADIRAARELIASVRGISARDALHAAVMRHADIERIFSLDRGFDACPGLERLG